MCDDLAQGRDDAASLGDQTCLLEGQLDAHLSQTAQRTDANVRISMLDELHLRPGSFENHVTMPKLLRRPVRWRILARCSPC